MTSSQENLCLEIARGDITEAEAGETITEEMREYIKDLKEIIDIHRANGRDYLVDAMDIDE